MVYSHPGTPVPHVSRSHANRFDPIRVLYCLGDVGVGRDTDLLRVNFLPSYLGRFAVWLLLHQRVTPE